MSTFEKAIVYVLRSESEPSQSYIGLTRNLNSRLQQHNRGSFGHTRRYRPWSVVVAIEFRTEATARRFERYLKSGSGRAFTKRHFAESLDEVEIGD